MDPTWSEDGLRNIGTKTDITRGKEISMHPQVRLVNIIERKKHFQIPEVGWHKTKMFVKKKITLKKIIYNRFSSCSNSSLTIFFIKIRLLYELIIPISILAGEMWSLKEDYRKLVVFENDCFNYIKI